MGKPIQKGDLVMVVRGRTCCGNREDIGSVHTVTGFHNCCTCTCGKATAAKVALIDNRFLAKELSQLIRIDPPAHGDSLPTRRERKEIA